MDETAVAQQFKMERPEISRFGLTMWKPFGTS